jgi:hypothetical protein
MGLPWAAIKSFLKKLKIFDKLNINIIIANRSLILNNSKFNALPFDETTEKLAKELFTHEFGFGRADIAEQQSELAYLSYTHKQLIEALKPYLSTTDLGALVAASTVVRLEDKRDQESKQRSQELLTNLRKAYGSRGRKIYNMLRSKVYQGATIFHSIIMPFLEDAKKTYPKDQWKVRGIFSAFFDEILRYYPRAIWVDNPRPGAIRRRHVRILGRITKEQVPVSVYARKSKCIKAAKEICELILEGRPELQLIEETYNLGPDIACMFTIIKKLKT